MKITSFVAITLALALATTSTAEAQRRRFGNGGSRFVSNGKFGLGLELGEPFGINGKLFLAPDQAIDFGVGDLGVYHNYYLDGDGIHLYVDYLWHPIQITETEAFKLPFYVGVGGRVWFFDYGCRGGVCSTASLFGIRVPLGITFDLNSVPLDIFGEFVPTLDFYRNYAPHSVYLDVDFSVGIRYWFS
jgi:hypothetical protein